MGRYRDSINNRIDRQIGKGVDKYGQILEQNPRGAVEAIEYGLEEITDLMMYLEETKEKVKRTNDFIKIFDRLINSEAFSSKYLKKAWNEAIKELEG